MRKFLQPILFLIALSPLIFSGCKKDHGLPVRIEQISTAVNEEGNETGTFTSTGGIRTSGTFFMEIKLIGTDSIHCLNKLSAPEGTITMRMRCSMVTNKGEWNIISGTERYRYLRGSGSLVMIFPPGEIGREISTGHVFFGW